jgi:hypothetical protein
MTDTETDRRADCDLDALFAAARAQGDGMRPSEAFRARVIADAASQMPRRGTGPVPRGLWAALGGWAGASGLVAATAVGLWIGVVQPVPLPGLAGDPVELALMPESDLFGTEG